MAMPAVAAGSNNRALGGSDFVIQIDPSREIVRRHYAPRA